MHMHRARVGVGGLAAATFLFCGAPAASAPPDLRVLEAETAARAWLQVVDQNQYGRSWLNAASLFRSAVPKDTWRMQLAGVRKPLGEVVRRDLIGAKSTTSLPGAPDGEYVVLQFRTHFRRKASAIETVTPMRDTDGVWRVGGYYIK